MNTVVRNRLAELLLYSFNSSEYRAAIEKMSLFCELSARRDRPEVLLGEMLGERDDTSNGLDEHAIPILARLTGEKDMLQIRRHDTGEVFIGARVSPSAAGVPLLVQAQPNIRAAFPAVCERVRIYADLVARMGRIDLSAKVRDPLRKAMGEAALCFNAGLFFEAHEHLEHFWAAQPKGATKRFLQGIIQISVGFHHAGAGKYDGAINQLGKGLDKTSGTTGEFLGLDCDSFLPRVAAVREAIVRRGRGNMRPLPTSKIPRMLIQD
jgi:predicted metal-dependent hydrolase